MSDKKGVHDGWRCYEIIELGTTTQPLRDLVEANLDLEKLQEPADLDHVVTPEEFEEACRRGAEAHKKARQMMRGQSPRKKIRYK